VFPSEGTDNFRDMPSEGKRLEGRSDKGSWVEMKVCEAQRASSSGFVCSHFAC
jgi:hypothetical protein